MPSTRRLFSSPRCATILALAMCGLVACLLRAQTPDDVGGVPRSPDELQTLVAPIALYPDALLAQVLAASTYPDDVVDAARWLDAGNDPQGIDAQPWDSSVKGVARYPSILRYMASNGEWMNDLGDAFINQQGDVMAAVQDLRGQALAAGTLTDTPQQTVINQNTYIQIVPTNPQFLYAPIYDPAVVFAPPPFVVGGPPPSYITFGAQVAVGPWLSFDLDWYDRSVYYGAWGANRPWWNVRGPGFRYATYRPGLYRPGSFRDSRGRPIQVSGGRWTRDARRPPPRPVRRPPPRPAPGRPVARPSDRPGRGDVPPRATPTYRPPRSGADVSRYSERGRSSREAAAAAARPRPTPTPTPSARPSRPTTPAPVARPSSPRPTPDARPSSPSRGGATSGYQGREAANSSSARGAASRGGSSRGGSSGGGSSQGGSGRGGSSGSKR